MLLPRWGLNGAVELVPVHDGSRVEPSEAVRAAFAENVVPIWATESGYHPAACR